MSTAEHSSSTGEQADACILSACPIYYRAQTKLLMLGTRPGLVRQATANGLS